MSNIEDAKKELGVTYSSEIINDAEAQYKNFSDLLDKINMDDKLRILWKQTYKNALDNRKLGMISWQDLYMHVHGNPDMHALHGDRLVKYLERMEKANDQILKLTDLVQKIKMASDERKMPKGNDLFDMLENDSKQ